MLAEGQLGTEAVRGLLEASHMDSKLVWRAASSDGFSPWRIVVKGSAVSIQAIDGGEKFLARGCSGVVSVALNYRLGVLGYLVVDGKANHGLLDTIEALRWIKTNIRAFGGDPERITIYGQSSGGSLVLALLASPLSNGLYSRAISMSGSPRLNSTLEEARDYWHQEVYQGTKCRQYARNATALRRCLLALTPHELTYAMPENWDPPQLWSLEMFSDKYVYAPLLVVDGEAIPSDYLTTFANDPPNDVPTAIGVTRQEVDFIPGTDARNLSADAFASLLFDSVEPYYGRAFADKLLDMYNLTKAKATQNGRVEEDYDPSKDMQLLFADIMNDASALCTTRKLVESMSRGFQSKVYFYAVSQLLSGPLCCMKPFEVFDYCPRYSYHAIDEFALFEWNDRRLFDAQAPDNQFSLMLQKWFINFALSGDNPEWVPFKEPRSSDGGETYAIMDFNNDFQILKNLKADECSFFLQHGFYESKAWVN
eukprot:CAMPEP_0170184880 /NCGR_PEP_ID=MMETSP0040_2-20121228/34900_1 /TAXON_ID=641309 /ORGANISM="Lotharella oceanica, Strain CCMP622" /LENGTH=480 /DNA_ID=CAMNT_0010431077 /DNA_START=31 /DNA_END=1474 /DNA_ORIENTATION=-